MKIVSLNTWGGRVGDPFDRFIQREARDTDVFCFQEIYDGATPDVLISSDERPDLYGELLDMLPGFSGRFFAQGPGVGIATFVRESIPVSDVAETHILTRVDVDHLRTADGAEYYARPLQIVHLGEPAIAICNFHGVPGDEKRDTPLREVQTERLLKALGSIRPRVLVGDFNLAPDTRAIALLASSMRDLVRTSGATTTRSSLYDKRGRMPYADYAFVTPDVHVERFSVLADKISDHLPLSLTIAPGI